ncbi:MAG: nicotinate-nucleotide--dimethylbenzimidazole phosphoribosyltransferase [Magnetococcales bacterium]|nr:nicotinate-nucleotide--dimethylbenzimidazole phosphoribosyltransferase [Magnetococcales bacterium]
MIPSWFRQPVKTISDRARLQAGERLDQLCKPPGGLGILEYIVLELAGMQDTCYPEVDPCKLVIFAADHGIAKAGISAFPQPVSTVITHRILGGRAAPALLAESTVTPLEVIDFGVQGPLPDHEKLRRASFRSCTEDFRTRSAMSADQFFMALHEGKQAAERAKEAGVHLLIPADVGMDNNTSATAVLCALLGLSPNSVTGPDAGQDEKAMARKVTAIQQALDHHSTALGEPMDALMRLGGLETAAMCGTFMACAQLGIAALVDGFVASVAALAAVSMRPALRPWLLFSHRTAEPGHFSVLKALNAITILQLDLRMGGGLGALCALPLMRNACLLQRHMSTFQQAGIPLP